MDEIESKMTKELKLEFLKTLPSPPKKNKAEELLESESLLNVIEEEEKEIPKSEWFSRVLKKHPSVLETRERVTPLTNQISFGKLISRSKTEVQQHISNQVLLNLIMQHLETLNLGDTIKTIEKESGISYNEHYSKKSRLLTILRVGIKDIDSVWDLNLKYQGPQIENDQEDPEVEIFDNYGLGEFDDEDDEENRIPDIDIWDEPPDSDNNVCYIEENNKKILKAATLNKLIENLTNEKKSDTDFMKIFLMTCQSFTTPRKLLRKLLQRYNVPRGNLTLEKYQEKKQKIQIKVCNVLISWIKDYFSDFNESLINEINNFIENAEKTNSHIMSIKKLKGTLAKAISGQSTRFHNISYETAPLPIVPKNIFSPSLDFDLVDEEEIARQMTIIDFEIYSKIKPAELLNLAWSKPKLKHRSKNVICLIHRFNDVSNWVASSIIRIDRIKKRAKQVIRFVKIAEYLRNLNNYNSLMSVLAGLTMSAVHRLKFTKEEIPKRYNDIIESLSDLMSTKDSYKASRDALKTSNPPCIPYLGIFLTDLTFIEEGNNDFTDGLINFYKRNLIAKVIKDVQIFQQKRYNFMPVMQISKFLSNFDNFDSDVLYEKSLLLEPRKCSRSEIN
ncbi:ras guanine nucleotide exchange factor i-related [Anaeramoeba flamelloides]|uniref:Ras guanine nucleotide exchange factor i-related n=1 Tax=Anaeramoeba flamelloides TaxID=1746091 RepID=A0AAV7ZZ25_9EUKA|nr:ras guanine nucleotide exchange factor i-related [Anaeramoeba flamelloides]KAJ6242919.1 ras guanine nucleotide exchange factor i-related [Anaeramoeba flamelloides]